MLEILNRYAHGLTSIPMLQSLRERGCLARLGESPVSAEELAREFSANRGYLDVALRMLVCLEWLRPTPDGQFEATPDLASANLIPGQIMDLYRFPFDRYVLTGGGESLEPWLKLSEQRWNSKHPFLPDYLDGLLIIPLLLSLRSQGRLRVSEEICHLDVDQAVRREIESLLLAKGWAARYGDVLRVNRAGRFVIDRIFVTATVASYIPMFGRVQELLFGDAAHVFERDPAGNETHVDRTVNVIGSGFQHEKFFAALCDLVVRCFGDDDYASQPKYIVDMGCGDGTLLRRLYEAVRDRTLRGKVFATHPLIPVAVDFNEKALAEASRTLAGIDHIAVNGDIGDPAALLDTLRANGVEDLHRVLHVRSFLDHDRPYRQPEDRQAAARRPQTGGNVYISADGQHIPMGDMLQSTVEHLRRWSRIVNENGLVLLEVHCLTPDATVRYRDESENLHFDVYHALSHQFLLDAQGFLACAAEAGLFRREGCGVGFPKHLPYKRITLNHFERRPYLVRRAIGEDLPALAKLQEVWPRNRSTREYEVSDSEFVIEREGCIMASIRCSQNEAVRLTSAHALPGAQARDVRDLLQFVEQYWALSDVRLAGIDDCRSALPAADEETSVAHAVSRAVKARVSRYPFAVGDDPRAAERELGTFSFRWLLANLQRMGVILEAERTYDLDEIVRQLMVTPRYHRYFDAMMRRLQDEGLVRVTGRRLETTPLLRDYALTSVEEQVAEFKESFRQRYPASVGLMNMTARCLGRYEEVITGRTDITNVLFENGDMDVFAEVFRGDVVSNYFNRIVADAVHETVLRHKATMPKIRILEIGAGTGGTTVGMLEVLQPLAESVEFCFSDISPSFIRSAKRRFSERYPGIVYRTLNAEDDLSRQGFEEKSWDIVVAANVLHDTRDIEFTLRQTRKLLRPGGLLLLNEYTFVKDCLSFSGALLHGWWLFEDPQRRLRDSCLMSVPQWGAALEHSGFSLVEAFTLPTQSPTSECTQSVMLCEAVEMDEAAGLPPDRHTATVEVIGTLVEQQVLLLLGEERAYAYSAQRPVMDMGLDSIELVELKSILERSLGVKLTPMFVFEYETPGKMMSALSAMVSDDQFQPRSTQASPDPEELGASDQVAAEADRDRGSRTTEIIADLIEQQALILLGEERASAYSAHRPVMDMGLDSLELVELKSLMERGLGVKLTPMFLFEHETPGKMATALSEMVSDYQLQMLPAPASAGPGVIRPSLESAHEAERAISAQKADIDVLFEPRVRSPLGGERASTGECDSIAIVGVACRFPGGAVSADSFWKLMESGRSGIVSLPSGRWRWPSYVDPAGKHKGIDTAGFLERIDEFDAPFFRISPKEAELMDPQQRLLLELSWEAMEDAGHRPSEFSGRKIGVFVGACHGDYREVLTTALDSAEAYLGTGSAHSLLSNRLSYFYDFKGPSLTIDTACSSSLFALHHAVTAIRRGDCEQALVGAANLLCSPSNSVTYYQAGMLSPTGSCRTFDASADGFVRGEGGAVLLVKPLAMALTDGDAIYGLITGTAVNHGGQAASLTAPKPEAQAAVIEAAWQAADVALESVGYIEAHGTGTRLGDPVEVSGLIEAFRRLYRARGEAWPGTRHCGLGSVKTSIGHLEGAAGLAGLIKVLLAIQHRSIPATLNLERLNPDIDLAGSPFYVVGRNQVWAAHRDGRGQELPRCAGVSSFGFGGSNAHAVIEEHRGSRADAPADHGQYLIPLSARNDERLADQAKKLLEFLTSAISGGDPTTVPSLSDLAYTLQVGREPMEERIAFVVGSREELMAALHTYIAGKATLLNCHRGHADLRRVRVDELSASVGQDIEASIAIRDLANLASQWAHGIEFDWTRLSAVGNARRTHLPTYPFAKERYWIESTASGLGSGRRTSAASPTGISQPLMHPLLHTNSSNLSQQSYSATFTGDEFFLSDHQVRTDGQTLQKILPGVAYLEMARAAIDRALPMRPESTILELRNTVWVQPIVVTGKKQVSIALVADDNDQIDFDFYSLEAGHEIVHCQGHAVLSAQPAPEPLDVEKLSARMLPGRLEPVSVYAECTRKGLVYGPSFQAITAIHQGRNELLAYLRLPTTVDDTAEDYILHPSLIDGALQAASVLVEHGAGDQPRLLFALESLRIVLPCTREMVAWVRFAAGSQTGDKLIKLDIDLCDDRGNVCAEMHGLSLRERSKEPDPGAIETRSTECLLATPVWQSGSVDAVSIEYTAHHVILCGLPKVNVEKLQSLLPRSQCLSLHSGPKETIAQLYGEYALACFDRIQAILQNKPQGKVLIQIVVADHQELAVLAGLSGLLQTATLENPQLAGQLILDSPQTTSEELARQLGDERTHAADPLVKYELGIRQVWRWQEVFCVADESQTDLRDHGVYLITGGLGGLGVLFAKEILEQTRLARVVLTGRSPLSSEKQALLDGLPSQAARVSYRPVNLSDLDQVKRLITAIRDEYHQLNGILHSAGVVADSFILNKTRAQFVDVLLPKVSGTYNLDQASQDVELDFFVLFSSIAGAIGNAGQADYAAANGFMDHFAAYRNRLAAAKRRRGRTRAINWPLWEAGGMSMDPASLEHLRKKVGMRQMQTVTGMRAFHRCLALPYDQVLVMEGDSAQIRGALLCGPSVPAGSPAEPPTVFSETEQKALAEHTQTYLLNQFSQLLKLPAHKIDPRAALREYGIDSILAMQLIDGLDQTFGPLSKTLFFEYQSIRELAEYFCAHHSARLKELFAATRTGSGEATPVAEPARAFVARTSVSRRRFITEKNTPPSRATDSDSIAIIGLSGRYPKAADIDAYWSNLRDGKDCIVEVPRERWDWRAYFSADRSETGRHYSKWGGFIEGVDEFDPLFFSISPREAQYMDPQERLFLQHAWAAVEDAGYTRARLQVPHEPDLGGQVGVYVGVMWSEYQLYGAQSAIPDRKMGFAGNVASVANRVSYILNLHGPSVTLDTMCSSALSAIHFACQDLKLGRTSMAIAGGVNVSVHPNKYLMLSVGQFISGEGHCQSFGDGGDGYIPGEGVGAVVLKRLTHAERDGDHIYGVIRGSALNHGGSANGYTVPNPQAQAGVIGRALAESGTDARHISYVEAHGTGTRLGDPIEIAALSKAFGQYTQDIEFCRLGSAKSNIGHCESAAGIAGLTKVLLQMQHRQIVPSLHSTQLNPYIDFRKSPFIVNQTLVPWEQPVIDGRTLPRIAGISSFGAGGSNAHMIIEEYRAHTRQSAASGGVVILLSARTPEQLREKARDLHDFVLARVSTIDLSAAAYTLQTGREAMEERLGCIVSSAEQLAEKLRAYAAGQENIEDFYRGQVKRYKEALSLFSTDDLQQTVDKWIAERKLAKLVDFWVRGMDLDWSVLNGAGRPQRISLPTYPFSKERYWIDVAASTPEAAKSASAAFLHPLLHSNTSDLNGQRYSTTFTGEEFFLTDHLVAASGGAGLKVLPGVAYLEMVRTAIEQASQARPESTMLELRDIVWLRPLVVTDSVRVSIALSAEDDQIDFEIYSQTTDEEILHCQGHGVFSHHPTPPRLDLGKLVDPMTRRLVEPDSVYAACARMGLIYGPGLRGIMKIQLGENQLLASLRLPDAVADTSADYVLHPSLMDAALQASVGLSGVSYDHPRVPFALKSLRIIAPCTREMVAWVRSTSGTDSVVMLDIDLCDELGNSCVQMRGLSLRSLTDEAKTGILAVTPVWETSTLAGSDIEFAECDVLSLRAEQDTTIAQRYTENALTCFERIRTILQGKPRGMVLFQVVVNDDHEGAMLSGLSGLLKTAALENPHFVGQIVTVPGNTTPEDLARHLRQEKTLGLDALVKYEQGQRLIPRWQEVPASPDWPPVAFKENGVYLITGGFGGLGILFATEILEQASQARVILTGRSALTADKQAIMKGLSADRLSYRQVALADLGQVRRLIDDTLDEYGQLNGILHSAGMIADNFIVKKTSAEFVDVLMPKVTGTFNLDQASKDVEIDFFVLFSSFAGAMGNPGQADYAAGNGFLDRFAAYRNEQVLSKQRHGRTRSIDWGLWLAGGMAVGKESLELLRRTTGMHPLQTTAGVQAFYRSLALPYDQLLVVEGELPKIRRVLAAGPPKVVSRSMGAEPAAAATDSGSFLEGTQKYLQRQFSDLLKLPAHKIDPEAALEQYGIDSVLAMQLINRLEQTFGALSKTLLFEYQTVRELSRYFIANHSTQLATLFGAVSAPVAALTPVAPRVKSKQRFSRRPAATDPAREYDPIAVIGLSGRYPEAADLDSYWKNLREGKDCITEVPLERWDWRSYFSDDRDETGRHYSKWGGFIAGVDEFDPLFFNIAPKDAKYIDPQERIFLQQAWMAVEDAGYSRARLQVPCDQDLPGQVGVYVGVMWSEYALYGAEMSTEDRGVGFAGSMASIANRVSYALNLHGPSMTVDSMCSSSLTAIHLACQDLKERRTSLAIAGGVNVTVHPNKYLVLSSGQFISSEGHCRSFGEGGEGYIPGEGVGVVILKRLSEAKRDGDNIYGLIRGSALNHSGKTNGYTVPNPQAQASMISRALVESRTDARHISYVEAHGTGTKLGDPIEIAALSKAFGQYTPDLGFCQIGSAKSNIGHCESAAGIAGLTKVLLQMQHQEIVPSLHSARLNPNIDFAKSPFVVNQTLRRWEQPVIDGRRLPRIAGVSSFGAGGSNAHVIVEEFERPVQHPMAGVDAVVLLSARTTSQLLQKARDLVEFVRPRLSTIDLGAIAFTLQVGREPMEERLGFVVDSVEQLAERLQAYVTGQENIENCYRGQVTRNKEALSAFSVDADLLQTVNKWIANRRLVRLLDLWVKGLDFDWSALYGENRPQRISLPAYPFARERHWIDTERREGMDQRFPAAAIHPLLHVNVSNLSEQLFRSTFTGEEFFIAEQGGQKVLPAAACLEMVRAAMEQALLSPPDSGLLELRNTAWGQPIVVSESRQISIALFAGDNEQIDYEIFTGDESEEIVHCQGRAIVSRDRAPATLDLEQLRAQGQRLVQLRASPSGDYVLHPTVIGGAMAAAVGSIEGSAGALGLLRIVSPCTPEMFAWVRNSGSRTADDVIEFDIDLCDDRGNVAAQMRGLSCQRASLPKAGLAAIGVAEVPVASVTRTEIIIPAVAQAAATSMDWKKPVALAKPGACGSRPASSNGRTGITLSNTSLTGPAESSQDWTVSPMRLYDCGSGILSLEIGPSTSSDIMTALLKALERAQDDPSLKVLMLSGIEHCFARPGRDDYNEAVVRGLFRRLVSFAWPTVAVLRHDTIGAGFLAAALCDFMVCNEDAHLGYTNAEHQLSPTAAESAVFSERFGSVRASHLLYRSIDSVGRQLRADGWTCPILPSEQVETHAMHLASMLATKSRDALRLLKAHLTRTLAELVTGLTPVEFVQVEPDEPSSAEDVLIIQYGEGGTKDLFGEVSARHKAIVLLGEDQDIPADVVLDLQRLILESEIPIVAALPGNARGNAWLVSQFCDASVYSQTGLYSSATIGHGLAKTAVAVFAHRFGGDAAREILLTGADYSGADLQRRVAALRVAERDQVLSAASRIASSMARIPRATLGAWKKETAIILQTEVSNVPSTAGWEQADNTQLASAETIVLQSRVVTVTAHPEGIVVVKMEDRAARNMFSDALVDGVREAFEHIEQTPAYKVVILTGYDTYFASGGTKESLLAIQEGKTKFTDSNIFHAALDCRLPVIAAMQGHSLGAGWSMGMFADVAMLSDESKFESPYMSYGFTPGAGATFSLPDKLGNDLARESLLAAQQYAGHELKERGTTLRILPRVELFATAMTLARQIARGRRGRLIGLKQLLTAHTRKALDEVYRRELAMHEATFVGRADTLATIERYFQQSSDALAIPTSETVPPDASISSEILPALIATLKTLLATELQIPEGDLDENSQFVDLGLDSITSVSWIRKINQKYQTAIEATKVYSYPTLTALGRHVREEAEKQGTLPRHIAIPPARSAALTRSVLDTRAVIPVVKLTSRRNRTASRLNNDNHSARATDRIAVIGMAGKFPQARNLDEFWRNISQGRNCITQVPRSRWDVNAYYQPGDSVEGKTNSKWMGALDEYDQFDPLFFNISPIEAESMDPQQRLFLQACWHSIENAAYDARGLSGSRCGVFVGCGAGDYQQLSRRAQLSAQGFTGNAASILAARISYWLNLQGPCLSIDTACSSSLVAIAQACDSLVSGVSDLALAGGVYVMASSEMHIKAAQAGMLSAEGKCFAFDQRADGFVPGEGVGVVMLKRLVDAQRDQDIIHGVIQGWGINQDGKTNGITAPNPESQTRLEQEVYEKYQIDPAGIQLIEAHGTGTKLGDPIEVEGLKKAFGKYTRKNEYCALGSVKSNIGHCLTAAGIAGVLKLLLALKHKQLPPTINFERLNEHIDLKDSPFYVNTTLQDWTPDGVCSRQAAISSFGFSGTNAHIVLGEYLPPAAVAGPVSVTTLDTKFIVPLSARTTEQLRQKVRDLLAFLEEKDPFCGLVEIAYSLQVGRVAMDERLVLIADSVQQLTGKLEAWLKGEQSVDDVYQGQVKAGKESLSIIANDDEMKAAIIEKWLAEGKQWKLLRLWVKGLDLDWGKFYGDSKPRRVSLPLYPFAKERYWLDASGNIAVESSGSTPHPLLHRNTSDLRQCSYSSTLTGDESFLTDHRVRKDGRLQKVLPGVAYLEMAQAAIRQTWPRQMDTHILVLCDTVWLTPVFVEEQQEVSIALVATGEDRIEYDVYSVKAGQRVVHCQGHAVFSDRCATRPLEMDELRREMGQGRLEPSDIYAMFADMGLHYGPAHQGIAGIDIGEKQLLAELRLPALAEIDRDKYMLNPSLMDSALQASIGLAAEADHPAGKPAVPFALESLRILSACTTAMWVWVRCAEDSKSGSIKLDIELCDGQGNICVQIRGLALRVLEGEAKVATHAAADQPEMVLTNDSPFDEIFYERLIGDVLSGDLSVDQAAALG